MVGVGRCGRALYLKFKFNIIYNIYLSNLSHIFVYVGLRRKFYVAVEDIVLRAAGGVYQQDWFPSTSTRNKINPGLFPLSRELFLYT